MVEKQVKVWFLRSLKRWHFHENGRNMPWKGIKDPYRIWLSEVILQQTRVEQGISYFLAFVKKYPSVHKLAQAPENEVFKLWEGLGYYSRCRNLIHTAKHVSYELDGKFPSSREGLISLKGVGPYTAAAIGSFAFGLPLAVVDGNVMRVLSRFLGIKTPIDSISGKKKMEEVADALLDKKDPAWFNQAMMDLGATVCKPKSPDCVACPLHKNCVAFSKKQQDLFPVKAQKVKQKKRFLFYLILECKGQILIRQRTGKDIWQDLFEFVLIEKDEPLDPKEIRSPQFWDLPIPLKSWLLVHQSQPIVHQLSHQQLTAVFSVVRTNKKLNREGYTWVYKKQMHQFAFPRLITRFLENHFL